MLPAELEPARFTWSVCTWPPCWQGALLGAALRGAHGAEAPPWNVQNPWLEDLPWDFEFEAPWFIPEDLELQLSPGSVVAGTLDNPISLLSVTVAPQVQARMAAIAEGAKPSAWEWGEYFSVTRPQGEEMKILKGPNGLKCLKHRKKLFLHIVREAIIKL